MPRKRMARSRLHVELAILPGATLRIMNMIRCLTESLVRGEARRRLALSRDHSRIADRVRQTACHNQ